MNSQDLKNYLGSGLSVKELYDELQQTEAAKRAAHLKIHQKITRTNIDDIILVSPYRGAITNFGAHLRVKKFSFNEFSYFRIEKGLHSYSDLKVATHNGESKEIIVKCIIPKGTKYYYNPKNKEYVSLELKLLKKIHNNPYYNVLSHKVYDKKIMF